jgi:hypothetical protein
LAAEVALLISGRRSPFRETESQGEEEFASWVHRGLDRPTVALIAGQVRRRMLQHSALACGLVAVNGAPHWVCDAALRDRTLRFGNPITLQANFMKARLNVFIGVLKVTWADACP